MKTLHLQIYRGTELIASRSLTQGVIKIGKLKSSHICLEDDAVARMHAVVEVSGADVRIIDLGSPGGTSLNGTPVARNSALTSGDVLSVGPYRIEVRVEQAVEAVSAPQVAERAHAHRLTPTVDSATVEVQDGSRVAEVIAMYGDTVLDVQHVGQVANRRSRAPAWLVLGGIMFAAGAGVFAYDASQDWEGYREQSSAATAMAQVAPAEPGTGLGGLALGLALLGIVPFAVGLARLRDDSADAYTVGEGDAVSFHAPTDGLPEASAFSLVRKTDDGFLLSFTERMTGEVTLDGQTFALGDLVKGGRAAQSGGCYVYPIPANAACTVRHGTLDFHVNSVAPGRVLGSEREADKPFWLYNAASLATVGTLLVMANLIPEQPLEMSLEELLGEPQFVGFLHQPEDNPEEPIEAEVAIDDSLSGGQGQRHVGEEGKAGKPTAKNPQGLYDIKGPKDAIPQLARRFNPDLDARRAGILGQMKMDEGSFMASNFGEAFAIGNGDEDIWGGLHGTEVGEAYGVGGLGLVGAGRFGGGTGAGTIGLGNVGTIGHKAGGGEGLDYGPGKGRGKSIGFKGRRPPQPRVRVAKATVSPGIDKDVIRRIVRVHINEVRHCYNQGLVRDPNLRGRVAVQFTIGATGKVPASVVAESSVKDRNVGRCIAKAVKRWRFPKPRGRGSVIVTYPFALNPG